MTKTKVKEYYEFITDYIVDGTECKVEHVTIHLEVNYKNRTVSVTGRDGGRFEFRNYNHFNKGKKVTELVNEALSFGENILSNYKD